MNNRSDIEAQNTQLEREFISLLFTSLSSKKNIDDAVLGRESVLINRKASSLSAIENLNAFNNSGNINAQNCEENNISFNPRMDVIGYQLPNSLSMREKIILNAAILNAQHELTTKYKSKMAALNAEMDELNKDGGALADPARRDRFEKIDNLLLFFVKNLSSIPSNVMQKMSDASMESPLSNTPNLAFLHSAFNFLLTIDGNQYSEEYLTLLNSAAQIHITKINQFKNLTPDEQNNFVIHLIIFIRMQNRLVEDQWKTIQPGPQLKLLCDVILHLKRILDKYSEIIGPLPNELMRLEKVKMEGNPEWEAMLFLMAAKEYLTSPERKWDVSYQWKEHTIPGSEVKIPKHVAQQLEEIDKAEKSGQFKLHKENFLEIGMKKRDSLLSSGASNTYFRLFKDNAGRAPEGEAAKKELEDKLGNLFRRG